MSPIQQIVSYSAFLNGGTMIYPKLTSDQETAEPKQVVSKDSADLIRSYLLEVVTDENGTAHELADLPYSIGAKTATAEFQNVDKNNGFVLTFDAENNSYMMLGMLEESASGDVIELLKPVLEEMPKLLQ